jgi:hypothetical protein
MKYFFIFFINLSVYGQYFDTVSIKNKINFINYLKTNKQTSDALYLLNYFNSQVQIDSLQLLEVKVLLELRREKDADSLLKKTERFFPDSSALSCTYKLLKNHVCLLSGKFENLTEPACFNHALHKDAWRIQLLSASVLKRKADDFEMLFNSGKSSDPVSSLIEFDLYILNVETSRRREKNGFLAGLMSAIIPGTGKLYAGKPHEVFASFLPVAYNLVQAGEGYYYKKFDSPHFYIFGTISSVFYASNILGSVKAAKRKNEEFSYKIKANVEFEITKLIKYY